LQEPLARASRHRFGNWPPLSGGLGSSQIPDTHWQSVSQISPSLASTCVEGPQVGSPSFLQRWTPYSSASQTPEQQSQLAEQISP